MKLVLPEADEPALSIAALIDMVFLLLIYFMVTASLVKSEGDLGIRLPGVLQQAIVMDMPDEQIIEIHSDERVLLNGAEYGRAGDQEFPDLVATLTRYRLASQAANAKALITVWADDAVSHQRVIDVLNACAWAGIENITFTSSM